VSSLNGNARNGVPVREHCAALVDDQATVDGAADALDANAAARVARQLGDVGRVAAEGEVSRDAACTSTRQGLTPACALGGESQHAGEAAGVEVGTAVIRVRELAGRAEQLETERQRISTRGVRKLVEERLDGERICRMQGCAPRARRDCGAPRGGECPQRHRRSDDDRLR
jgi:hypothetical protein